MTRWVLDDGPFGELALRLDTSWGWPADTLHMVREVARSAALDRSGRRQRLLGIAAGGEGPSIRVHDLVVGSTASDFLYNHLRVATADATEDLGEHASIAFCATEAPDGIFVTADKTAAYLALAELGPHHVATPFDLWSDLSARGFISTEVCQFLCERAARGLPGLPPRIQRWLSVAPRPTSP